MKVAFPQELSHDVSPNRMAILGRTNGPVFDHSVSRGKEVGFHCVQNLLLNEVFRQFIRLVKIRLTSDLSQFYPAAQFSIGERPEAVGSITIRKPGHMVTSEVVLVFHVGHAMVTCDYINEERSAGWRHTTAILPVGTLHRGLCLSRRVLFSASEMR